MTTRPRAWLAAGLALLLLAGAAAAAMTRDNPASSAAGAGATDVAPVSTPAAAAEVPGTGAGQSAGATKVNAKDGLTYVWIPQGSFQMGASPGCSVCDPDDERPPHKVAITRGFWMGQTPVTQAAYQRVIGSNPSHFHGEQLPVETVDWDQATAYCSAVGMRLPTEAEWEYAARAETTGSFYCDGCDYLATQEWYAARTRTTGSILGGSRGLGDLGSIAWYADNSGNQPIDSAALMRDDKAHFGDRLRSNGNQTHPVRQKLPNAWKLYDMLGNVWQWTADWYDEHYYQHCEAQDPKGPASGQIRVFRGGSWTDLPGVLRASNRVGDRPGGRKFNVGFRCVGE
ncbi:MAG: formylglycine-generating enzyme family protein [Terriglobales bacterium]